MLVIKGTDFTCFLALTTKCRALNGDSAGDTMLVERPALAEDRPDLCLGLASRLVMDLHLVKVCATTSATEDT